MRLPKGKPLALLLVALACLAAAIPLLLVYDSPLGWIALIIGCSCSAIASLSVLMAESRSPAPVPLGQQRRLEA